ncbi:MAG: hypothetical protein L0L18_02350 [Acidipropionibacterium jensenii]|nr:hypothetical protein [Acidipropionibacterium acidipropionici]MDN6657857.1 hypothetical protein [Acidipropionibacterium jensenii]
MTEQGIGGIVAVSRADEDELFLENGPLLQFRRIDGSRHERGIEPILQNIADEFIGGSRAQADVYVRAMVRVGGEQLGEAPASGVPTFVSKARKRALTLDWTVCSRSAAADTLWDSATAMNSSSSLTSMSPLSGQVTSC